jgi:hypothetical protein
MTDVAVKARQWHRSALARATPGAAALLRAAILIAAGLAIIAMIASGSGSAVYPVKQLTLYSGAVILEAALLLAVLRPASYRNSWRRALAGAGLCALLLWGSAQITSASPEYAFTHRRWLAAACAALVVMAIAGLTTTRGK